MDVAEAAREAEWVHPSFVAELFMGRYQRGLMFPYPEQSAADRQAGDEFCAKLDAFLRANLDADEVDRTREIPAAVVRGLADLGCFGIKIPVQYGGLGMSQVNYNRAMRIVASVCGSTAVFLSAHQSIGVPQPLKLFGTEEQKRKYLPRFAKGAVSAFALTEPNVGSDPANMLTTATPTADGSAWILNGEKIWCTNGNVADVLIVMARTPDKIVEGKARRQITAFIVEKEFPGFEIAHRCDFMGLKAIQNGLLRFKDMRVPRENVLWETGAGLKLALVTLNTGRLTVPACMTGMGQRSVEIVRAWSNKRVQWGLPIGKHELTAGKIAWMTAQTFAMDAVTWYCSAQADHHGADIRLEAAMSKLFTTEAGWKIVDEAVQIRGGRGYETSLSLKGRGEEGIPVERMLRDARINLIIEGTSEIMRLFIAREAVDRHMKIAFDLFKPGVPLSGRIRALGRATAFYAVWYPGTLLRSLAARLTPGGLPAGLGGHDRFVRRSVPRLARAVFHSMLRFGPGLEKRQRTLARLVDIGTDLFAMSASLSRAAQYLAANPADRTPAAAASVFCEEARRRVRANFRALWFNDDTDEYRLAQDVLAGKVLWLEKGIAGNL